MQQFTTPCTAIVVEDNKAIIFDLQMMLKDQWQGANRGAIKIVASIHMLLRALDEQTDIGRIELIVLDYAVQGRRMSEYIGQIREHPAVNEDVLIVGHSGHRDAEVHFKEAGANGYISKNVPPHRFVEALNIVEENRGEWTSILS